MQASFLSKTYKQVANIAEFPAPVFFQQVTHATQLTTGRRLCLGLKALRLERARVPKHAGGKAAETTTPETQIATARQCKHATSKTLRLRSETTGVAAKTRFAHKRNELSASSFIKTSHFTAILTALANACGRLRMLADAATRRANTYCSPDPYFKRKPFCYVWGKNKRLAVPNRLKTVFQNLSGSRQLSYTAHVAQST